VIVTSPLFAGPASGSPALVRGLRSPRCRYEPWRPERIRSPRVETAGRPGCSRMSWPGWLRPCAQRSSRAGPGQAAARQIKSDGPGGAARRSDRQCFSDLHTTKYRMPDNPSPWRWMSSLPPAVPLRGGVGEGVPFDCSHAVDGDLRGDQKEPPLYPPRRARGGQGGRELYRPSWIWPYGGIAPGSRLRRAQALASRRASSRQLAQFSMWARAAAD
jgi:hypothetical protein